MKSSFYAKFRMLTHFKVVRPGLIMFFLTTGTLLLLAATNTNYFNPLNPFVRDLLPENEAAYNYSSSDDQSLSEVNAELFAPCDQLPDTIRVNMGGGNLGPDAAGRVWTSYAVYNLPGNIYASPAPANTDNPGTPNSNGTSSAALYQNGLFDQTLDMHFPVPNGDYTVVLHFSDNASSVGARVFDVTLENTKVEDNFDVFATAGGQYVALARSYPVTVNGNDLSVLLVSETVNAIIQGIEIIPLSSAVLTKSVDMDVAVTGCYFAGGQSRATVQARVNWNNAVPGDVVNISLGGVTRTIRPGMITVAYAGGLAGKQVIVSPQDVSFEVPADGATGTITANFNGDVTCETTVPFTAPAACEPTTCAGGAGVVGGYAFIDNNRDGTEQGGEVLRKEDVVVRIYESDAAANSTLVSTTTTDAFGNYSFSGLTDGERYRVEFDFPGGGGLDQTVNGSTNRTSVQFITSPTCAAHIGITDSEAFCQDNPQVLVPCYVKGNHLGIGANRSALVGFPYRSNGAPASGPITNYATIGAVGALWGLAYDKNRELMYSASTLKRHNGLLDRPTAPAEGMLGGIFATDMTAPPATSTSFLVDLEAIGAELGFIGNDVARGLTLNFGPDTDATAFAKVGKAGIGDIDVTPDGNFLFYTNLFERKLGRVRMDDDNNPSTPYTPVSGDLVEFDLPAVSCAGTGTLRPWALKVYQGKVYVGAVCDAMGGSKGDLQAFVFAFDVTSEAFDATPVFDFPLTYPKGFPFGSASSILEDRTGWHPWTDDFSDVRQGSPSTSNWVILYPVPILSDIEFDIDGALVLGFMDRTSQQIGYLDLDPSGGPTPYNIVAGGDVLRAYFSNGNYILENNAKAGPSTGYGPGNNQGPGLGEFYNDDFVSFLHSESFLGGLALRPGSGEVMTTALDPTPTINTNGVRRLSNTTGQTTAAFEIVNNVSGTNRKGNSLGDLELACVRFTEDVQIGGYIWGDANPDGIQASSETPIAGVTVQLFDPVTGDLLATTTTDANGEYYFTEGQDSDPNTPGVQPLVLLPNTNYTIVMGSGQFDPSTGIIEVEGAMYQLTTPNTGQGPDNSLNDSNGQPLGVGEPGSLAGLEGYPSTSATTPNAGSVDHSFDVGLLPICDFMNITASGGNCDSDDNSHEVAGTLTFTNAPITGTLTIMIPGFGGGMLTFDPPFTSPLDYTITGVASNGETRSVIATFSENSGMCADTATYLAPEQCLSCTCNNFVYLNEPGAGTVLKFRVEADSSLTLIGNPFASGIGSPHGLGIDANGFLYIGSATTRQIFKYTCDGTFVETLPFTVLQTNTVIKGNYLYTTVNNSNFVQCFDLCTNQRVGYLDFAGIGASWGLSEGEDGNLYVAGGQNGPIIVYQFPADPDLFKLTNFTVYNTPYFTTNPGLTGTQTGIDVDEFGNVYLATMNGVVRKVAPDGTVLATLTDFAHGGGFNAAFGITYNRETKQLYTSQNNPNEDCIAVFDTEPLAYRGDLRVPASPPLTGKGIGILQECCPTLDSIRIDTTICATAGVAFELNELLPCSGLCAQPTPGGGWTRTDGTGGTFNDCDLSFTVDEVTTSSCFKFSGGSIGGSCFPYVIDICFNIVEMTPPEISGPVCSDPAGEQLSVSVLSTGVSNITYQWQRSTIGCVGFLDIPGATGLTYTPTSPAQRTFYRVKASSVAGAECEQFSNCLRVELDTMATTTLCAGGSNSFTFNAAANLTNVVWFNEADVEVGTGASLLVSGLTPGLEDGQENFRYTALDANGDPYSSACPFRVLTEPCTDLGDLPAGYPTTLADGGPSHLLVAGLGIGATIDTEADGVPSALADGDGADEDGIATFPVFNPGQPAPITVSVMNTQTVGADAILYGFIDWNGDGDFDDENETVSVAVPDGTDGDVVLPFVVPVGAVTGADLGVRIRLSTDTGLGAGGPATDGEVEDYLIQVAPCTIALTSLTVDCSDNSTFMVSFNVDYDFGDAATDMIQVTIGGVPQAPITPGGATGSVPVGPVSVPGPAYDVLIEAAFVNNPLCATRATVDLVACSDPCVDGTGLGGNVFNDFDNDGADAGATEVGQANVKVEVYDCDGVLVCDTWTNADGDWSCPSLNSGEQYRVEFSTPLQPYLQPSIAGADNGTNTQFVTGGNCDVDYGVIYPGDYCIDNPALFVPCYGKGDPLGGGTAGDVDVLVSVLNDNSAVTELVNADKLGSIWGQAYHADDNYVFLSAVLRRHSGLGPLGIDGIYIYDIGNNQVIEWLNLNTIAGIDLGSVLDNDARGLDDSEPYDAADASVCDDVLKVGIGDIDYDPLARVLYVSDLNNRTIHALQLDEAFPPNVLSTTNIGASLPTVCEGGESRPFGLKWDRDRLLAGVVCDAAASQNRDDLAAYVYEYKNGVWIELLEIDMSYTKGFARNLCAGPSSLWHPWNTDCSQFPICSGGDVAYPQPALSDIEVLNNGNLVLAFADRTGLQFGSASAPVIQIQVNQNQLENGIAGGDILAVGFDAASNAYALEMSGTVAGMAGTALNNNQGPGGGEFFNDNAAGNSAATNTFINDRHRELTLGSIAASKGSGEVITTLYDPMGVNQFGIRWLNAGNGSYNRQRTLAAGLGQDVPSFGKASALGDLELICGKPPIQVGNYVWLDTDEDGVQDACEAPVAGLPVNLYTQDDDGTLTLVASTTTGPNGEYYFTGDGTAGETWVTTGEMVIRDTSYLIVFGDTPTSPSTITFAGTEYGVTQDNSGEGNNPDLNDSDGVFTDVNGISLPSISFSTADSTDHTLDLGLVPVPPCDLEIVSVTPDCTFDPATGGNTFTVAVSVGWNRSDLDQVTDQITVTLAGQTLTIDPANVIADTMTVTFTGFTQPAYDLLVTASFDGRAFCTATTTIDLIACPDPCTDGLGGTAFNDFDNDGVGPDTDVNDRGQENVRVEVYDCEGMLVCETYTDANGDWSCPTLTSTTEQYRVEFSTPLQPYLQPSVAGPDNGTNTQFVTGGNCDVDYGVVDPNENCEANPFLMTSCFVSGATMATGDNSVLVKWPYLSSGLANASQTIEGTKDQMGTVWGLAYARKTQMLYSSTFLKRHAGLPDFNGDNEGDLENIYVTDIANGGTTLWLDLGTQGIDAGFIPDDAGRGLTLPQNPSVDSLAYGKIGEEGLGDLEISSDFKTLFSVNLFSKELLVIDVATKQVTNRYPIPDPGCVGGAPRPFALKYYENKVYVGVTCDASVSRNYNNLSATVYQFDPATPANGFISVLDIPLNYVKGFPNTGCGGRNRWFAWYDWPLPAGVNPNCTANFALPQPLLTDLEFDTDGSLIMAFVDRYGHQNAAVNLEPDGTDRYDMEILAGGDLLRAYLANGAYVLESGGVAGNVTGAANNQGPGGGEFYNGEFIASSTAASETAVGGVALLPGSGQLAATVWDPFRPNGGIGVNFLSNTNGRAVRRYEIAENPAFGKGGGLGDLELLCSPPPIQIGNYAWVDTDGDGIQDPCEMPLVGLMVKLYTKPASGDPVQLASTTTDVNGNYYFVGDGLDNATWQVSDTIAAGERYFVAFCGDDDFNTTDNTIMIGAKRYCLAPANTGEGTNPDQNDSDATAQPLGNLGTFPAYCTLAGETDTTNHNFDVGFKPVSLYDLALRKTLAAPVPLGVRPGDLVTFNIEVINQSDTTVYDVVVGDSLSAGMTYVSASASPLTSTVNGTVIDFTDNYAASQNFLIDSLLKGDSVTFQVTVMISPAVAGQPNQPLVNFAEIQAFDDDMDPNNTPPVDEDSTPDDNFSNDSGGAPDSEADDFTGGNGTGMTGDSTAVTDEDDADPSRIPFYDLALTKTIDPGSISPTATYSLGDPITFNINVTNQGFDSVANVIVKDEIPCGYSFAAADNPTFTWSATGPAGGASDQDSVFTTITGPIGPGDGAQVQLTLRYQALTGCTAAEAPTGQINRAEIRRFEDTAGNTPVDFDSTPDGNPDNDGGGVPDGPSDNVITGDGTGGIGSDDPLTDEDDADPSSLNVFDLAIYKVVDAVASPPPYAFNQIIKFDMGVVDQGNLAATEVVITDLLPPGLEYDPAYGMNAATGWVGSTGDPSVSLTIDPTLPGLNITRPGQVLGLGDTLIVSIWLRVVTVANPTGNSDYTNYGEITSAKYNDPVTMNSVSVTGDGDSPYGLGVGNDTGGGVGTDDDNETRDNNPGEDIDSQDPAFVSISGLTLGSTVFIDNNNDGMQNGADAGIPGVVVQLFDATTMMPVLTGPDGILGTADDADPTPVMTDGNGDYLFADLPPGDYYVVLPTAPASAPLSSNNTGIPFTETDPDTDVDGDDEGLQPGGSGTAVTSGIITLTTGLEPTTATGETGQGSNQDENATLGYADSDGNMTLDFGFFAPVSVGDTAFVDLNGDGLQTMGEPGIGGVTVVLLGSNGDTVMVDAEGNAISGVTTTAADGSYLFPNLPPGSYSVLFDISTADNAEFYDFTMADAGGDDANDSDNSISLSDSTAQSDPTDFLNSGASDQTLDVGVQCTITVVVSDPFTICSTQPIILNSGASITPASLGGAWSTPDGTGTFTDGTDFTTATTYIPSKADALRGSVTLVLTSNDPAGPCEPVSAMVTIQILKVDCGTFPWGGDNADKH